MNERAPNAVSSSPGRRRTWAFAVLLGLLATAGALAVPAATPSARADTVVNLVSNPGFEQQVGGAPTCWEQSGYGTNTAVFTSSTGATGAHTGTYGESIAVSNYTNGDRKALQTENGTCAPHVTPGHTYSASVWYHATGSSLALTAFVHSAGGWQYWTDLTSMPAVAAWSQVTSVTPAVPAGVDQLAFGVSIAGNGTLWTDDYVLADTVQPTPSPTATVSATTTASATPTPTTTPTANLVNDPGFETVSGGAAQCWEQSGYGSNSPSFSLGTGSDANSGTYGGKLVMANWTNGDAKFLQLETGSCAPMVTAGHQYNATLYYKATTANIALTVFQHQSSGWSYWTDLKTLAATATWTQAAAMTPVVPAGVDQISFGVSIYGNGTLDTDDYALSDTATAAPTPSASASSSPSPTPTPTAPACTASATVCARGQWSVLSYPNTVRAIHSVLLANGKVLVIAGSGNDPMAFAAGTFKTTVWDPVAGTFTDVPTPSDLFCAGHVQLPNGNVLVMGGTAAYPAADGSHGYDGSSKSYVFNISTNTYQRTNDLNAGHWYPSATELGSGDILTVGGLNETSAGTVETEYYSTSQGQWLPHNSVNQSYHFWGLYPSMVLMQDGRLFYTGSHVFGNGLSGTGASIYDYVANTVTDIPGLQDKDERDQSASVLLPPAQAQKVITMGGGNVNTNVDANRYTDLIDLTQANPSYTPGPLLPQGMTESGDDANMSMGDAGVAPETGKQGKMYVSAVLLPDRSVLETGGGLHNRADPVFEASIYSPTSNSFSAAAVDPVERMYHSESFLLPDGRVASLGSNPGDGSFDMRISIYSPGYLFRSDRPAISSVGSTTWAYGASIPITTSENIVSAELIRPAAVTHSSDPNQRLVDLPLSRIADGSYTVNVTSNPNLAPPGYYMLFVQNAAGTPSIARWVHVS